MLGLVLFHKECNSLVQQQTKKNQALKNLSTLISSIRIK